MRNFSILRLFLYLLLGEFTFAFSTLFAEETALPAQLGPLVKIRTSGSPETPAGLGAIYINKGFLLDFFRHDSGKENLPDGIKDKNVETAFNTECGEWEKKKNRFKDLTLLGKGIRILKCPAGKELQMYYASYSYRNSRGIPFLTELFVTGYSGDLVRIRFTSPAEPLQLRKKVLEMVLNGLEMYYFYYNTQTQVDEDIKETVFQAVSRLENDPLGKGAAGIPAILSFVENSSDVLVVFDDSSSGWLAGIPQEYQRLFTAAFAGGNIREQLRKNVYADMPEPGIRCVLKTYDSWKKARPGNKIESLEKLRRQKENTPQKQKSSSGTPQKQLPEENREKQS